LPGTKIPEYLTGFTKPACAGRNKFLQISRVEPSLEAPDPMVGKEYRSSGIERMLDMRSTDAAVSHKSSRNSWWAQALHNRLIALVLAMVVIIPLVASPAQSLVGGATAAIVFEGFAILLATTLLWRARWDISREWVIAFLRTGANLPVLLLMGLALVSCVMAPHKAFAVQATLQLGAGVLLYFVVAYQFRQSKHLYLMVDTLLFLTATVSLLTLGQYTMSPEARGTMLYGNQQPLGSLLMILLPIVAVIALADKNSNRQLAAQCITVMTIGSLLLAHTRSAWFGAAAGLIVLGLLSWLSLLGQRSTTGHRSLKTQKHKLVLPLMLTIISVGFFLAMAAQNSSIVERAGTLSNVSQVESFQIRENVWRGALAMIKARPLTGWGIGQYPIEQLPYTGSGTVIREGGVPVSLAENAHNFYLQTAAELGILGLLLLLAVLVSFLVTAIRRVPLMDMGVRRTLLMGSIAAVVAFAVDALASPSWQFGQVSMFLWLVLGIGVSCLRPRT
jgi:O-antigen ligase